MKTWAAIMTLLLGLGIAASQTTDETSPADTTKLTLTRTKVPKVPSQPLCPVTKDPVDKKIFLDLEGKRIYFCCTACLEEFRKNPDKYLDILDEMGAILEKTPVSGNEKKE
ncbi:YHS domain-containing protein [bacterium]|nr:YHS domain-containing protein [bacterium]